MKTRARHSFLSHEWFDAVEQLRPLLPEVPDELADTAVNVTVAGGPDGAVALHLVGGAPARGHDLHARTEIEVPYGLARSMLVDGDLKGALAAFLTGELLVKGDLTPLLSLQALAPNLDDLAAENAPLLAGVRAITAEDRR